MPTIRIPAPFRIYTAGASEVAVQGETVSLALADLLAQHPDLRLHLVNAEGRLRPHINLFVESSNMRDLQGLDTPLETNTTLRLVPSIAGG
ncbi:MAG: MoaD/ThiS family protein [Anaerolineales bacterium]|jgi:adenylyltransferase/sulfurtransferase|nr:MoaD/ThiS family protein [Anaerolineales bacterium]